MAGDKLFIHQFSIRVIQASATWSALQHDDVVTYLAKVEGIKPAEDWPEIIDTTFATVLFCVKFEENTRAVFSVF